MSSNMRPYVRGDEALPPLLATVRLIAWAMLVRRGTANRLERILEAVETEPWSRVDIRWLPNGL